MRAKEDKPEKSYVGDVGEKRHGVAAASLAGGMIALALVIGFLAALVVRCLLWLTEFCTSLIWEEFIPQFGFWWLPAVICALGGLLIGLTTWKLDAAPESLEKVLAYVKSDGGYHLKRPVASAVGFLLPLAFGGSVGPEAGLSGIIAAACTWIGNKLKSSGLAAKELVDVTVPATLAAVFGTPLAGFATVEGEQGPQVDFKRGPKIVLYLAAAFGAIAGLKLFGSFAGEAMGLPRFDEILASGADYLWAIPCLVAGVALAFVFRVGAVGFGAASRKIGNHPVIKPVLCGIVMGLVFIALPDTLFSGEAQATQLMDSWAEAGAVTLLLTAVVKSLLTPGCLAFGWKGGTFFPSIFAGVSCGYGIAALSGADPMLCVAVCSTAMLASVTRKPLLTLGLLLLCFPVSGMLWTGLAAFIAAAIPVPAFLLGEQAPKTSQKGE